MTIPFIDPNVIYVGVSELRKMNSSELSEMTKMHVLTIGDEPTAVLMPFEMWMEVQKQLQEKEVQS